jgi:hypothetical protein
VASDMGVDQLFENQTTTEWLQSVDLKGNGQHDLIFGLRSDQADDESWVSGLYIARDLSETSVGSVERLPLEFTQQSVYDIQAYPANINGDSLPDLHVFVYNETGKWLYAYVQNSDGQFEQLTTLDITDAAGFEYFKFIIHDSNDVNRDGREDLLIEMKRPYHYVHPEIEYDEKKFALLTVTDNSEYELDILLVDDTSELAHHSSNTRKDSGGKFIDWNNDDELDIVILAFSNAYKLINP